LRHALVTMPAAHHQPEDPAEDGLDALTRAYGAIVDEARARVAAGQAPNLEALEARIRSATGRARGVTQAGALEKAERLALQQLERVITVHRARALLARRPAPPAAAVQPQRPVLRTRPTITGNMDVRREMDGERFLLGWDAATAVAGWEVRFSERPDARSDYRVSETVNWPADAVSVEVPLGERPLKIHLLGRSRDGRLLRRAVIAALTRENWNERWQRRASAS
jgi:hypothetical protein